MGVKRDYSCIRFKNETTGITNDFEIMTISLNYIKKDSKFEHKIQANNLLNARSRLSNSINANGFTENEAIISPRFVIFILKYNI